MGRSNLIGILYMIACGPSIPARLEDFLPSLALLSEFVGEQGNVARLDLALPRQTMCGGIRGSVLPPSTRFRDKSAKKLSTSLSRWILLPARLVSEDR